MSARVVGAILAFAAAGAFVLAIFSGAWWDGHPAVNGATIARKDVHIGILGAHGCNRGETYECSDLPLDDIVPALLVTAFLAAIAGALFSIAVGVTLLRREERRKLIAKIALALAIGSGVLVVVLVVLGPGLKAEHVTVPIGYGTIVFALGAALSITGSVLARLELPVVRPEVAPTEPPDAFSFIREEAERPPPSPGGNLAGYSGPLGAQSVDGAPLFAAAPQLRPLYEMDGGSAPTSATPPRFPQRAPTPIPRANISAAVGIPTPPPFSAQQRPPTLPPFSATGPTPPAFPATMKPPTTPPAFSVAKPPTTPPAFSAASPPASSPGFVAKPPTTSPGLAAKPPSSSPGFVAKPPTTSPPPAVAAKPRTTSPGMPAASPPAAEKPKVPAPARATRTAPPPSRPTPTPTPHTPPPNTPAPMRAETDDAERAATLAREDRTSENPVVEEVGDATSPNIEPATAVEAALPPDDGEEQPTARQSSSQLATLLREKVRLSDTTISTSADTAPAEVVPRPETVTGVDVVKVVSTAPDSLPPPVDQPQASGPSPACPQCEAPMRWVEEHLRFYCKSCRMYF